ncbi:Oxygen-independent coproporphyrinogen-III oxidase [Candidatus Ornithobacterium hominis]|uniref:Coproporphyrinogen-III oxidase n=1 Tax=Candidatus Ornithobacterium hominis TaxID=2497989 RepID=A0A383U2H4_9FLAO|nr:oxygen-independent coproporphyrinogen III oxidase [Candidatus Ornithobacterium hominis]MCT7904575.1 oxygen-independent coproporphyrinogen III oxidase [Candidatus Ornithobacterium hominis]SZD74084.1 Oxygen-independent coproporphyrinogen-III oxidase [Candidatus Ornithobacterium hominis]
MQKKLIQKYNTPGPRYTSYPTVPYWDENTFSLESWKQTLVKSYRETNQKDGISVYIHLPFCESLCTFCACHKHITKRHEVEDDYIDTVLEEWKLYLQLLGEKPRVKELHFGGGTPTFFSPENLIRLLEGLFENAEIHPEHEFSIEGHPNNTTREHLQALYDFGFKRISFGVQDYDLQIQEAINRIQPYENVERVTLQAREIGYESISHDLVFGLPFHSLEKMKETIRLTKQLNPDRIAFYSYAHVPWVKGVGQRGFDEEDLPTPDKKRELYEVGKQMLEELDYVEIGMDHFALKSDSMYQAMINQKLHRNFMGYTTSNTQVMIGLGMSAISDSWYSFAQNHKSVKKYTDLVKGGTIPVVKGHILNEEDLLIRRHILNLMCHMETDFTEAKFPELESVKNNLAEMEKDELIIFEDNRLKVTEKGRIFVRNICMAFDLRMLRNQPQTKIFSMTI